MKLSKKGIINSKLLLQVSVCSITMVRFALISIFILGLFQLPVNSLLAQDDSLADTLQRKNVYKVSYSDELGLYLYGISKFSNFELKENGQVSDSILKYSPNSNFNIGAGFSYKWMGLGIAFNLGFINNDQKLKGKTNSLDLQLDIFSKQMMFNSNLSYYQGYYWNNPNDFFSDWNSLDSLVVRPDITTVTLGFSGIYIFNHEKFSIRAAYQYTERQVRSAGSFLLGGRFSLYGIEADSAIVPAELQGFYPNSSEIGNLSSLSLGVSFGYTHTFVIGNYFFINGLLMLGINRQGLTARDLNDEVIASGNKMSSNGTIRLAFGINKPKKYYGMAFTYDSFLLRNPNNTELTYAFGRFRLYYGFRFNVSKG